MARPFMRLRASQRRLLADLWDKAKIVVPAILLVIAGFVVAFQFVEPAPPNRMVMATGPENGAYHAFAKRYVARFAREGIELILKPTVGSAENLRLLSDPSSGVSAAFMQGGIGASSEHPDIFSLGSVYYEPLWVFVRRRAPLRTLNQLGGARIAVGAPGSGTRPVARMLLAENGITARNASLVEIGGEEAVTALLGGSVDAAFFVTGPGSSVVSRLLNAPGIRLASFARAEAYGRRYRFLSPVILPEGVLDLARNLPPRDVRLLAPVATVVANDKLHPALAELLLEAMREVHRPGGLLEAPGEFPSARYVTFPLSDEARRFLENGPSFLQRYLPFWAANLIDRLKIMILPLVTLLYPLFKLLPPTYRWRIGTKINRWYKALQTLDDQIVGGTIPAPAALAELDRIENRVLQLHIPAGYADRVYHLRAHIDLLRRRIEAAEALPARVSAKENRAAASPPA